MSFLQPLKKPPGAICAGDSCKWVECPGCSCLCGSGKSVDLTAPGVRLYAAFPFSPRLCVEDYFSELLGEEGKQDGSGLTRWINRDGNRVEALDGFVYALAAERASDVDYSAGVSVCEDGALAKNLPRKTD